MSEPNQNPCTNGPTLNDDEREVLTRINAGWDSGFVQLCEARLRAGATAYGPLDIDNDDRDWTAEAREEKADQAIYETIARIRQERKGQREQATAEPFIWVLGGDHVDLCNPKPEQISIQDIACALAHCCRWSGHVRAGYSVAQHSVLVSRMLPVELRLTGLLHDAHEAYIGDVSSPVKSIIGNRYRQLARTFDLVIGPKFGVDLANLPAEVKVVDRAIQVAEAREFVGVPDSELRRWFGELPHVEIGEAWPSYRAEREFLDRFDRLTKEAA